MYNGEPNIKSTANLRIVEYQTGKEVTDQFPFVIKRNWPDEPAYKEDRNGERYCAWPRYRINKVTRTPHRSTEPTSIRRYWGEHGGHYFILDEEREIKANLIRAKITELQHRLAAAKRELQDAYRDPNLPPQPVKLTGCAAVDQEAAQ